MNRFQGAVRPDWRLGLVILWNSDIYSVQKLRPPFFEESFVNMTALPQNAIGLRILNIFIPSIDPEKGWLNFHYSNSSEDAVELTILRKLQPRISKGYESIARGCARGLEARSDLFMEFGHLQSPKTGVAVFLRECSQTYLHYTEMQQSSEF